MDYTLLTVALDKDTAVFFKQGKYPVAKVYFSDYTELEKSVLRDEAIRWHMSFLSAKGYKVTLNKSEYLRDGIAAGFTAVKNGQVFCLLTAYTVKDYAFYSVSLIATDYTKEEALTVMRSLRIDGVPFGSWIKY